MSTTCGVLYGSQSNDVHGSDPNFCNVFVVLRKPDTVSWSNCHCMHGFHEKWIGMRRLFHSGETEGRVG